MSLLSILADIGTVNNSAQNAMTQAETTRLLMERQRRQSEIEQMSLAQARQMEQARQAESAAMQAAAANRVPDQPAVPQIAMTGDDAGEAIPATSQIMVQAPQGAVAGGPDLYGAMRKEAENMLAQGNAPGYANLMAKAKGFQQEGIAELAKDILTTGDVAAAARAYNSRGTDRLDENTLTYKDGVLTGKRANGADFVFKPKETLIQLGVFKPEKPIVVGDNLVSPDGKPLFKGTRIEDEVKKIRTKGEVDAELARLKATLKSIYGDTPKATELQRNAAALMADNPGMTYTEAFDRLRTGMKRPEDVMRLDIAKILLSNDMTGKLKDDPEALGKAIDKTIKAAGIQSAKKAAPTETPPGQADAAWSAAKAAGAPDASKPPHTVNGKTFTGKYTAKGKPLYEDSEGKLFVGD